MTPPAITGEERTGPLVGYFHFTPLSVRGAGVLNAPVRRRSPRNIPESLAGPGRAATNSMTIDGKHRNSAATIEGTSLTIAVENPTILGVSCSRERCVCLFWQSCPRRCEIREWYAAMYITTLTFGFSERANQSNYPFCREGQAQRRRIPRRVFRRGQKRRWSGCCRDRRRDALRLQNLPRGKTREAAFRPPS